MGLLAERGARLVVDAGGLNPAGLADEVRRVIAEAGLALVVAHVEGDDLSARLDTLGALEHLDTGVPLADSGLEPTTANAYLGGWGIAAALAGGADVVICPRVTDASLTVGAAAWWHRWSTEDWGPLAGAVAAAHVIECGPQATGGNFSGFTTVPRVDDLGYPIAEIAADGTAVITKHEVAGGTVTTDTVTAQLLYEIQGPTYLNPDVTVHLDDVVLTPLAPDRVEITGVTGSPPPPTTKLAMTAPGGFFGRAFALHGADVLNLWRPGETEHETTYASANVGMRSAFLDPRRDRAELTRLLAGADVLFHNRRLAFLDEIGLAPGQAVAERPGLVSVTVSLHGLEGPWAGRPGFDQTAGSVTGMMMLEGGGHAPRLPPILVVNDYIVPWLAQAGVVSALRRRAVEGGSYHVHVSLTRVALWILSLGLFDHGWAHATAGSTEEHRYLDPETFTAETGLGAYQGVTDQVAMSATPGHYDPVLVARGSSERAWR